MVEPLRLGYALVLVLIASMGLPWSVHADLDRDTKAALSARLQEPFLGDPLEVDRGTGVRAIVVLVPYDPLYYFVDDRGRQRGFAYEMLKGFEGAINKGVKKRSHRFELLFLPMAFDRLIPALREGRGDIVAAGLTITPEREKRVNFTKPYLSGVREVLVTGKDDVNITNIGDLAGKRIHVPRGSSFAEHLRNYNQQLISANRPPINIDELDRVTYSDLLIMVNSGSIQATVSDDHVAKAWSKVLPNIEIRSDIVVHAGGDIAWAVRKDSPLLEKTLNEYLRKVRKGTLLGNIYFKRYFKKAKPAGNPLSGGSRKKLDRMQALMRRFAKEYDWDWLALAAQAYQESGLDQRKVSPAGAVGIMQLLPSTAAGAPINITRIEKLENNIHAGVKYLAWLRDTYFGDSDMDPAARIDFCWAAYNAGPNRIRALREKARKRGLDPNVWFANVEHVAAETIGRETVDYVANVNRYYAAYRSAFRELDDSGSQPSQ